MLMPPRKLVRRPITRTAAVVLVFLTLFLVGGDGCGPSRGGVRRRSPKKLTPLVYKQHEPNNVEEFSLSGSGPPEGKLSRDDPKFLTLVPNYNPDILFKDEEGTGADRLMTSRCRERVDALAISVLNQWPGVRLRVTEGFDEEGFHAAASLHYEGRAIDLTTSDKDRSKYGMLARLAVEAGFDFVFYESRSHIHASVKSESVDAAKSAGCFHGNSIVHTSKGTIKMSELKVNDRVLAVNADGDLEYSEVILFLDRDEFETRLYHTLETENGANITVTPEHLLFATTNVSDEVFVMFAREITPEHYIFTVESQKVIFAKVTRITVRREVGVFAPLTNEGNIIVNNVMASCYAVFKQQTLAHLAFFPVRMVDNFMKATSHMLENLYISRKKISRTVQTGIHWYPKVLYKLAKHMLPKRFLYH